jgi:hypothetical protein
MRVTSGVVVLSIIALNLAGCAGGSIVPLSKNRAMITASAAPICGTTGAVSVANQMAAIATIKQGHERFIILDMGVQNNVSVSRTGPTYATTSGTFNRFGNTVYGSSHTTYGGQMTQISGSNDAQMQVVMLGPSDPGYDEGISAKATLGADWEKKVADGVATCL